MVDSNIILYCLNVLKIEMNRRKREGELQKLRRQVEELRMQNETELEAFREKHQQVQCELADKVDQINKLRQK